MDTSEWSQKGICLINPNQTQQQTHSSEMMMRRVTKPQKDHSINCPRCDSTNTKFCYYNNYSLSQPRYFCKTCRRYWTAGGTLRNVPVGGGSRKNKRPSPSSSTPKPSIISPPSSTSSTNQPSQDLINLAYKLYHGRDLNLSFPDRTLTEPGRFGPDTGSMFGDGFGPVSAMKMHPLFGAGVDGGDHGRLLFPFEDLKHVSMMNGSSENKDVVQGQNGDSTFFWNGVMGNGGAGGSW